jgi:[protein-PII] uridylyltransferase
VAVQASSERGTTAILAFAPHRYNSFAITTAVLDQLGLNIVDARITPTGDGFSLDLYHVLEEDGAPISDSERIGEIERALWRALQHPDEAPVTVTRRVPRQSRMFRTNTQIAVTVDERNRRSVLELIAGDRPGLLCDVGKVLMEERVDLLAAKIMTVGERAEDVFYLASLAGQPLDEQAATRLQQKLSGTLDRRAAA